jgi:hypothetical protein
MRDIVIDPKKPWLGGNIKGGDNMTYFPELWDFLIDHFGPKSICDIGCGEGHLMKYFHDRLIDVYGVDGMPENKNNAHKSIKDKIIVHDYTKGCIFGKPVDMVISCEFVEHVEAQFMSNFLLDFMQGEIIVMTHALPGQDGYHHVNCTSPDVWMKLIDSLGYHLSSVTLEAKYIAMKYNKVLWKTVLIFERNGR